MPDYGGPGGFGGSGGGEAATGGVGGSGYGGMSRGQNQRGTNYSPRLAKAINNVAVRAQAKKMETLQQQAALAAIQDDMLPVGFLGKESEEHKYSKDEDGNIWFEEETKFINW